jgi:hypothetical protein
MVEVDLSALFRRATMRSPAVTCNIKVVGYRFLGREGQSFRYAGDEYVIPAEGYVELIADKRRITYAIGAQSFPIDETVPLDQFSFRDVHLPLPERPQP